MMIPKSRTIKREPIAISVMPSNDGPFKISRLPKFSCPSRVQKKAELFVAKSNQATSPICCCRLISSGLIDKKTADVLYWKVFDYLNNRC